MKYFLTALLIIAAATLELPAQTGIPFDIEQTGVNTWRITVSNTAPYIGLYDSDSVASIVKMSGHAPYTEPGQITLPLKRFWLPVAGPGSLNARIVSFSEQTQQIALNSAPEIPGESPVTRDVVPGSKGYLSYGSVHKIEGVLKQSLNLLSARYNSASGALTWLESIVIEVSAASPGELAAPTEMDAIDQQIAAYNQDTERILAWFEPGEEMLKIVTPREGVYRITFLDAQAAGLSVTTIDPATYKVFYDGNEIPVIEHTQTPGRMSLGDYIEFYAPRKSGENGEYYNEWSDDNVFWLKWGGAPGLRAGTENGSPASGTAISTIPVVKHMEEDRTYHRGDSDERDGTFTDKRPGETWVWYYLLRDSSYSITVDLQDIASAPAYIVSKLKKSSKDGSLIRLTVNGITIKDFDVGNSIIGSPTPVIDTAMLDPDVLIRGINTITYTSIGKNPPGDDNIERVYLDYFDVYYQSDGMSIDGSFALRNSAYGLGTGVPSLFTADITNLPAEPLRVINTITRDTLAELSVDNSGNTRTLSFAASSGANYYVYSSSSLAQPSSITRVSMTNYAATTNAGEYIVLTHKDFLASAQRLANYRASLDGYQTHVIDVDDVYNEFNFGHKNPVAIKRLMMKAYGTWSDPKPEYLAIIGDASWDPKHLHPTAVKEDFVPAFGNPVSDTYYISVDSTDVYPLMNVGRIPCETPDAAEAVIDKIMEYESTPPADWHNRFLITGGGINSNEFATFRSINEASISSYLEPYCLEYHRVYKRFPSLVGYEDIDSIVTHVNKGVFWFNFVGHGGSRIIDIGIERPDIFDVQGKYHLFNTLSCNTAHYAEPHETGLNEKFTMAPNNGAIGTVGTSGLGYLTRDIILGNSMFESVVTGDATTFGEVLTLGKIGLLTALEPVGDHIARNTALQVTYLGDPATRIPLEVLPELAIEEENVVSNPEILTEGIQAVFTTEFQNYGFCMDDSVTASFKIIVGGQEFYSATRRIPPFAEAYSVEWPVSVGTASGVVTIEIEIATVDTLAERTKVNNKVTFERNILRRGVTPVFPHNYSAVSLQSAEQTFIIANPSVVPLEADDVQIELQIASNPDYTGQVISRSEDIGTVFTWFEDVAGIASEGTYYWRGRMVVDGVPQDWSRSWSFTAQPSTTGEYYGQSQYEQLTSSKRSQVNLNPEGSLSLGTRDLDVIVFSAANNQGDVDNHAQIFVNGVDYAINVRGFNAVVVDPKNGAVVEQALFDTYLGGEEVTKMISFLRNIPDDHYLALAIHDDANGWHGVDSTYTTLNQDVQNELKQFGCTLFDEGYPYVWFHVSYAMFGRRSEPAMTRQTVNSYGSAFTEATITVQAEQGTVRSSLVGPANSWQDFVWQGDVPGENSRVDLAIYSGLSEQDSVLFQQTDIKPGIPVSLSSLGNTNPFTFFELTLSDTTTVASPVISEWAARFVSEFPELGITNQVVESDPDSVLEGRPITLEVQVYNAGRAEAVNVPVYIRTPLTESGGMTPVVIPSIPAGKDEYEEFSYDIQTAGVNGNWNADIEVAPALQYPEYYKGNNIFSERFASGKDNLRPDLNVLFDGAPIVDLDFVSPKPVIEITLLDNSPLPVTDTSAMQLFLDGRRIWLNANPDLDYSLGGTGEEKFVIRYTPELRTGIRTLAVSGKDADGNAADSIPYQVRFQVKTENIVDQIYPVPNPSQGPMHFTFRLIGSEPPESGSIKVYTVAGRLIREMEIHSSELRIGFNRIAWDGRDQDGDLLANGVYLYKLTLKRPESNQEFLGKVAILR